MLISLKRSSKSMMIDMQGPSSAALHTNNWPDIQSAVGGSRSWAHSAIGLEDAGLHLYRAGGGQFTLI